MAKIIRVEYSALFNLGDYNNEKIGLSACLDEGELPEEAIAALREQAIEMAVNKGDGDYNSIMQCIWEARDTLSVLEKRIKDAQTEWNRTAEFLRAQGIKPDAPNLVPNLLPGSSAPDDENIQICNGEIEGEQDKDYESIE